MEIIPHSADEIRLAIDLALKNKLVTFTVLYKNIQLATTDIKTFKFDCPVVFNNPIITAVSFAPSQNGSGDEGTALSVVARNPSQDEDGKIKFTVVMANTEFTGANEVDMVVAVTIGDTVNSVTVDFAEEQTINGGSAT